MLRVRRRSADMDPNALSRIEAVIVKSHQKEHRKSRCGQYSIFLCDLSTQISSGQTFLFPFKFHFSQRKEGTHRSSASKEDINIFNPVCNGSRSLVQVPYLKMEETYFASRPSHSITSVDTEEDSGHFMRPQSALEVSDEQKRKRSYFVQHRRLTDISQGTSENMHEPGGSRPDKDYQLDSRKTLVLSTMPLSEYLEDASQSEEGFYDAVTPGIADERIKIRPRSYSYGHFPVNIDRPTRYQAHYGSHRYNSPADQYIHRTDQPVHGPHHAVVQPACSSMTYGTNSSPTRCSCVFGDQQPSFDYSTHGESSAPLIPYRKYHPKRQHSDPERANFINNRNNNINHSPWLGFHHEPMHTQRLTPITENDTPLDTSRRSFYPVPPPNPEDYIDTRQESDEVTMLSQRPGIFQPVPPPTHGEDESENEPNYANISHFHPPVTTLNFDAWYQLYGTQMAPMATNPATRRLAISRPGGFQVPDDGHGGYSGWTSTNDINSATDFSGEYQNPRQRAREERSSWPVVSLSPTLPSPSNLDEQSTNTLDPY
ncbi:hypothetical protein T265_10150 [Opisthorchis viverrini]|uniref:Uncharacterized protein n=1 Tax=Opisthorchis viverrini TaxID=6198 RepID=A0A075A2C9_OPIVI|nr:hypothetical protein T265_10150 [Opisthorchis viverrini]KER21554.1 hypothetical protein T265_10150 [Opisthorchis viverrini]